MRRKGGHPPWDAPLSLACVLPTTSALLKADSPGLARENPTSFDAPPYSPKGILSLFSRTQSRKLWREGARALE